MKWHCLFVDRGPELAFFSVLEDLRCRGSRKLMGLLELHYSAECLWAVDAACCFGGRDGLQC